MKSFGPPKFKFHAWVKKSIFHKSANWLDWPCPVSAVLQNRPHDLFFSFIFLNMKPLSEVAPILLVIQIQIQAVCYMLQHAVYNLIEVWFYMNGPPK